MRIFSKFSLTLIATSTLVLTGCQQYTQPQAPSVSQIPEAANNFNLQGKIGVKTLGQSGSAFFTWVQQQDEFDIELSGILGVGKTQISGTPGQVTLNSAKTGLIQAETPEELLERATGWQAPITHLVDWVQAKPATTQAKISKDDSNRPIQFLEDGWTVDLSYNAQAQLPNKLILKQTLESGQENRITMVIQNR
ncbi:lipoprotein insertase outer membrane protein LolB [Acinetobacter terrae]|uniref:lipoprotein insertase outer membrane protein LolB n=1 Tax=Acinetobacter terrae TaxID=2731247 RepID=UPI0007D864AC|nr:lipoprotein insertase outer membrane protein LolB [Acinetobacter terrae]NNH15583.1 outer membrane lipoprotein LolB [Acinetobacter terrae]OAL85514.1 outer membrane lipoprotein LolB [Acinetobacter terrae]